MIDTVTFVNTKGRVDPEYLQVYFGDLCESFFVEWPPPGERVEYFIEMPELASVEVIVTRLGKPIPMANVVVEPLPSRKLPLGFPSSSSITDDFGFASLEKVVSGKVRIGATHRGVTTFVAADLKPNRLSKVGLDMSDRCKLKVTLKGKPYRNDWSRYGVELEHESGFQHANAKTSDDGTGQQVVYILGLKPGKFTVDVGVPEWRGAKVFDTVFELKQITLEEGMNEVTLNEAPKVEQFRVVVMKDGKKVKSGHAGLMYPNGARYFREIVDGEVEFLGAPARELQLMVSLEYKRADWSFPILVEKKENQVFEIELGMICTP